MVGRTKGILEKDANSAAAVAAFTIAAFGNDDNTFVNPASGSVPFAGIFQFATTGAGKPVRIALDGISPLTISANVTRGQWITSDANGCGIPAAPAPGTNMSVIGKAMNSAAPGQTCFVLINAIQIQG